MVYICVICTGEKPSLSTLNDEHRRILEAIVSPSLNLAQIKSCPLWICESCQSLINTVMTFKNIALVGASHLLARLASVQQEQNKSPQTESDNPTLSMVKQDPDKLPEVQSVVKSEVEEENPQKVEVEIKTECLSTDENHTEPLEENNSQDTPRASLPLVPKAQVEPAANNTVVSLPTMVLHPLPVAGGRQTAKQAQVTPAPPRINTYTPLTTLYCCYACAFESTDRAAILRHRCEMIERQRCDGNPPAEDSVIIYTGPSSVKRRRKPQAFRCTVCYARFTTEAGLANHNAKYHKATPDLYICECKKEFKCKSKLKVHMAKHKKKESLSVDTLQAEQFCAECGVQFQTRDGYKAHMKSLKHNPREQWKFKCDVCEKKFINKYELKLHLNCVHFNKPDHQCSQCSKVFMRRNQLRLHVDVVHEGKARPKPHVCHVCGSAFATRKTLRDHLVTHSNDRPYPCPLCPATFKFKAALFNHNRYKHLKVIATTKKKPKNGKGDKKAKDEDSEDAMEQDGETESSS